MQRKKNFNLKNIADGTIVPCYIAADEVQTPKEGKKKER